MNLPSPDTLINRELGILGFQRRVLAQAEDPAVPLLERLRFLCIVSSNLDEFFEVRVAGLKEQIRADSTRTSPDGLTPRQQFRAVADAAHLLVARQYALFNEDLIPELAAHGIHFIRRTQWDEAQAAWIRDYFFNELMPVLTPVGLDPSHPFPRVLNKSLNFAVELSGRDAFGRNSGAAVVQAPRSLPRVIRLPPEIAGAEYGFVFLSSILHAHVGELFAGMTVQGCYQFRVTRNSDLFVDEEENKNLRQSLQGELPQRHFGAAVRLEVADNCSPEMAAFLLAQFELDADDLYQERGPVNLVRLMQVPDWVERPDLKFTPFVPALPARLAKQDDIFAHIRKNDILLHHPFESFQPVIDFIEQAAADPAVVAIRQTVYRTGTDSQLMQALIRAAQSGKEVTVVVELMARFDEEANINWAARLEETGAHVIYGVVGHKTHAKLALVVRREEGKLRRYVHLGTGNYHARTARLYTDFGLLTADEAISADVASLFTQITGLGKAGKLKRLWQSPFTLHSEVIAAINREAGFAAAGKPAAIVAKMNALVEPQVIAALYAASQAGVRIDLVIRGVCALRPGIPGLSETIRVRSVVGRFLEHSRIFYFRNGGDEQVYLSSADWMDRNFFRRIETSFPILNPKLKKRVINEGLTPYLRDNVQAWDMQPDGSYRRRTKRGAKAYCAQCALLALLTTPS
ncbi:polyphosphate kinase [Thiobacillus denitrificans ATCC 25259]|uniref:Polyphosphate kinase n=1 Tax=Thiobacillus denitrificans (strain ATCC 25259 / T1) TaxID=292415 RepID=Q3SJW1_THIDA|nr:polyphosphate kinase 1 [Thiobacillus denitrificans]AAZ97038.1 polyphosphate kinase [Thiobacillus denitrificans ATCC 25259]